MGGTRLKIGIVNRGNVLIYEVLPSYSSESLISRLLIIKDIWLKQCRDLGITIQNCTGISIAFPSVVDSINCKILDEYGKFSGALNVDLKQWAKSEFNLPLFLENDARAALIGEWQYGVAQNINNVVIITLGTGIGTSVLIEGRILRGKHFQAGCLGGHFTINFVGTKCHCGNLGCAELEASTGSLKSIILANENYPQSKLYPYNSEIGYQEIFAAALANDLCAQQIIDSTLKIWGALAVNMIHAYDPELIVLQGGVLASEQIIVTGIKNYIEQYARMPSGVVNVKKGLLGDYAALLGGAWICEHNIDEAF